MVWVFMTSNSRSSRLLGLLRISLGMAILPTSWSMAANSSSRRLCSGTFSSSATAFTSSTTERECSAV